MKPTKVTERAAIAKDEVDGEDGGVPELTIGCRIYNLESCNCEKTLVVLHVT